MVRSFKLIRGNYGTQQLPVNTTLDTYQVNGPPIRYNCRFGTAITSLGDINFDGVPDIAIVRKQTVDYYGLNILNFTSHILKYI